MPLFASRKTRSSKAAQLRPTSIVSEKLELALSNRGILLRLLLCGLAVLFSTIAVEGWRAPFPYRIGERAQYGITARADFKRLNNIDTERAQKDAAEKIPFLFRRDNASLEILVAKLRNHLSDIADAESIDDLSPETKRAFELFINEETNSDIQKSNANSDHEFAMLLSSVTGAGSSGDQIDLIIGDFKQFIEPLTQLGTTDPDKLRKNSIQHDSVINIIDDNRESKTVLTAGDILLPELLKETGRVGKAWVNFPRLSAIRPLLEKWLVSQTPYTLQYDKSTTQQQRNIAKNNTSLVYDDYYKGQDLVVLGRSIDASSLAILEAEHEEIERQVPPLQRAARAATVMAMLTVLFVLIGYYVVRSQLTLVERLDQLTLYLSIVVLAIFLGRLLSFDPWRAEIFVLISVVMIVTIAYDQVFATLTGFSLCLIVSLATGADLGRFVILMSASATAIMPLSSIPSRSTLIKVCFLSAATYLAVSFGIGIIEGESIPTLRNDWSLLREALTGAGWCLIAGFMVSGSLPVIEAGFNVVTDSSLLEMSDVSHPLLQALIQRAPGTYNHSFAVATIGETAADHIGANGLLVRVGAYFHDIGKMLKPQYFIENQTAGSENLHDHLVPAMSTLIIIGHVKDGVDLARQHHLPQSIIDFIEQHHGTTLVEYFYREATKAAEDKPDHKTDAEESSFRYPGPKPQTREAGVMMLADAVESASRTLSDPTPKRIENLVREITLKRLLDGQFEESTLTLSEIHLIQESLIKSLIGVYHGRVKYPEQRTA